MDSSLMGESAAILTSCLWTVSSLFFTSAGRRFGSFGVNAYRTIMAIGLLVCAHVVLLGTLLPLASSGQWFWVGLSGVVGLGIGDFGLFAAYVTIGPRRTVLVQASAPIFASLAAYFMLGEPLSPLAILGIAVTLSGIIVVILEKEEKSEENLAAKNRKTQGVFFGLISAMGQGFGVVLSKKGMYLGVNVAMNPVSVALIRMLLAGVFVWTCAVFAGKLPTLHRAVKDKEGIKYTAAGAVVGPFLGMTLSMVAVADTQAGIAQTLMSLMPVIIIPVIWIIYREKTNWRGILGAIVAIIGIAILFLT
ncbi:MAG: DMT family transporter [Candidatus Bathyarchaeia archaeon]